MWSKYKVTADKTISGDSSWCCVNLAHNRQVAGVVEFSTAVCSLLVTAWCRASDEQGANSVALNCKLLVTIETHMFVFHSYNKTN